MVIRQLAPLPSNRKQLSGSPPRAREVVMEIQQQAKPPYGIVLQTVHSQLAGDLLRALRQNVFGAIDDNVAEAGRQHDFGWAASDAEQLKHLGRHQLQGFSIVPDEVEISSWQTSLRRTEDSAPLINVLISRHFCFLSKDNPLHKKFLQEETRRRGRIEDNLSFSAEDLNRWTAAVGFCDLLSLYLSCGSTEEVQFPLSHPADPAAAHAPTVLLSWKDGSPRFSPPVLKPDTFRIDTKEYSGNGSELQERRVEWTFLEG
ncbi:MAG: DUF3891 family protein [Acidobacteriaceae bacterium]|nr:DUF3891 family protein [Acidobacteriaceae bacterium]